MFDATAAASAWSRCRPPRCAARGQGTAHRCRVCYRRTPGNTGRPMLSGRLARRADGVPSSADKPVDETHRSARRPSHRPCSRDSRHARHSRHGRSPGTGAPTKPATRDHRRPGWRDTRPAGSCAVQADRPSGAVAGDPAAVLHQEHDVQVNSSACCGTKGMVSTSPDRSAPGRSMPSAVSSSSRSTSGDSAAVFTAVLSASSHSVSASSRVPRRGESLSVVTVMLIPPRVSVRPVATLAGSPVLLRK